MSTLPAGLAPDIGKIAEPLLLAGLLHWGLFGVLSVQVYLYYLAFSNEPLQRKVLVYGVYAAEIVQTILYTKMGYTTFAAGFGNYEALDNGGLLWFAVPILSTTVTFTIQIFYAYRIKLLAESNLIPLVVALFALIQLGGGIAQGVFGHGIHDFSRFLVRKTLIASGIWNASSAVCDIIIAASMTYYLSRLMWKMTWKSTRRITQRLMRLIIETGTLTATVAIINLILYMLPGRPTYYQTPSGILGIMYATNMMVVLNSRMVLSHLDYAPDEPSGASSASNPGELRRRQISASNGGISVTCERWTVPPDAYIIQDSKELEVDSDIMHAASEV